MNKVIFIGLISLLLGVNSCNLIKPFLIKNKKKEDRKEKREEKKIERKDEKQQRKIEKDSISAETKIPTKQEVLTFNVGDSVLARTLIKLRTNDFQTFSSKTKLHIEIGEQKQNVTANFRLQKDKNIWISISAFGIEVVRALITPDSVKAFERINKKAFLFSYQEIEKLINIQVDFKTLQNLIIGNAIGTDGKIVDMKNLDNLSTVFIKGHDFVNQITFNKSDSSLKQILYQTMRSVSTSSVLISYADYERNGNYLLSGKRQIHIQDVKGAAKVDMEINKYEFNIPLEYPFGIPNSYKMVK